MIVLFVYAINNARYCCTFLGRGRRREQESNECSPEANSASFPSIIFPRDICFYSILEWHCSILITPAVVVIIVSFFRVLSCPADDCGVHLLQFELPTNGYHAWLFLPGPRTPLDKTLPLSTLIVCVSSN